MLTSYLIGKLFRLHEIPLVHYEKQLIESVFLIRLYKELSLITNKAGSTMENNSTIRHLVNDLLTSDEYSLDGLATYTGYPEDIIYDIAAGMNTNPTLMLSIKIIELHIMYRQNLYADIAKKIANTFTQIIPHGD